MNESCRGCDVAHLIEPWCLYCLAPPDDCRCARMEREPEFVCHLKDRSRS